MRMVKFEFYKILSKKLFAVCLVLFLILNIFVLYHTVSNNYETNIIINNADEYERIVEMLNSLDPENAETELDKMILVTDIALELKSETTETNTDEVNDLKQLINQYKTENPNEYKEAQKLNLSREELKERYTYLESLKNQIKYINSYDSFISEMKQRAEHQLKFSIFAKKGSFSYNNIQKTPSDFQNLNGIKLKTGNNIAIESSTTFILTDLLIFALIFLMCIYLFTFERDKELYALIRATKGGRLPLIVSKLTVLIFITFIICTVYYFSNILTCGIYSGFGDMTRNIQSVKIFINCNLNLQIWQYLVLWSVSKIVTMCVVALLLSVVFVIIKNTSFICVVTAAAVLTEGTMYATIGKNAPFNQLKYINFFYFLSGNNVFGNYLNINFFSYPVNLTLAYAITMFLLAAGSVTVVCIVFVRQIQNSGKSVFASVIEKYRVKFKKIRGRTTLLSGECYKHYKGSLAILALFFLAFVAYGNLTDDISLVLSSTNDIVYNAYMNELEGELTPEKEKFLQEQQDYFDSLYKELENIQFDKTLSAEEKEMKITAINSILDTKGAAFSEVIQQASYIKEMGTKLNITPQFINYTIYKKLVENPGRELMYFTILMAVIIFVSSNIFAYEHKKHMVNLIRCTRKGKMRLVFTKISVVLFTSVISYILIYLPYYINFIRTFGTTSLNSPIVFIQDFSSVNSTITINEMIFVISVVHIALLVMVVMVVTMLSQILKNNILSMILSSVAVIFPCLLCINLPNIRLFVTFQNGSWLWCIPILIILCIIISIVCFIVTLFGFSKYKFKNITGVKNGTYYK